MNKNICLLHQEPVSQLGFTFPFKFNSLNLPPAAWQNMISGMKFQLIIFQLLHISVVFVS